MTILAGTSTSCRRRITGSGEDGKALAVDAALLGAGLGSRDGASIAREDVDLECVRETLSDAVHEQMAADVPLGAFLSGGIDSTIIVGLMQKLSPIGPVKTFSIGFDDPKFDESGFAEIAAKHLGTEHHAFKVRPRRLGRRSRSWRSQFDEPFADSSALPTWFWSRRRPASM